MIKQETMKPGSSDHGFLASESHLCIFSLNMKLFPSFPARLKRRSLLRDLHAFGIVNVFRRPSIFRIWEPLRELPHTSDEMEG